MRVRKDSDKMTDKPFDVVVAINALAEMYRQGHCSSTEALKEMNEIRAKIGLDPFDELPLGWRKMR